MRWCTAYPMKHDGRQVPGTGAEQLSQSNMPPQPVASAPLTLRGCMKPALPGSCAARMPVARPRQFCAHPHALATNAWTTQQCTPACHPVRGWSHNALVGAGEWHVGIQVACIPCTSLRSPARSATSVAFVSVFFPVHRDWCIRVYPCGRAAGMRLAVAPWGPRG